MRCKNCGSKKVVKAGFDYFGSKRQRYLCKNCNKTFLIKKKEKKEES